MYGSQNSTELYFYLSLNVAHKLSLLVLHAVLIPAVAVPVIKLPDKKANPFEGKHENPYFLVKGAASIDLFTNIY